MIARGMIRAGFVFQWFRLQIRIIMAKVCVIYTSSINIKYSLDLQPTLLINALKYFPSHETICCSSVFLATLYILQNKGSVSFRTRLVKYLVQNPVLTYNSIIHENAQICIDFLFMYKVSRVQFVVDPRNLLWALDRQSSNTMNIRHSSLSNIPFAYRWFVCPPK